MLYCNIRFQWCNSGDGMDLVSLLDFQMQVYTIFWSLCSQQESVKNSYLKLVERRKEGPGSVDPQFEMGLEIL